MDDDWKALTQLGQEATAAFIQRAHALMYAHSLGAILNGASAEKAVSDANAAITCAVAAHLAQRLGVCGLPPGMTLETLFERIKEGAEFGELLVSTLGKEVN